MTAGNDFDPAPPQPELFSALLTPHRSLNRTGFLVLMGFVSVVSFAAGLGFSVDGRMAGVRLFRPRRAGDLLGVPDQFPPRQGHRGNLGDAVRIAGAPGQPSRPCRRSGCSIRCGSGSIRKPMPNSASKSFIWSRKGRRISIASFLGPDEKASFAKALTAALQAARRGPTYNPVFKLSGIGWFGRSPVLHQDHDEPCHE